MFDTHCHLNFKIFKNNLNKVIKKAKEKGVKYFLIPGTDIKTSEKAIEIADQYKGVYAACGIHPHHIFKYCDKSLDIDKDLRKIKKLICHKKVLAVGEIGLDRYQYEKTKYMDYKINNKFFNLQEEFLKAQIKLAVRHGKSVILHNRQAVSETLDVLDRTWDKKLKGRVVFHCCEPDERLLKFAKKHRVYIGVDGDVTYSRKKQEFIKNVPIELLVLETDSPFILPEPVKSQKKYPNEPSNLILICKYISNLLDINEQKMIEVTKNNAKKLFRLPKY